MNPYRGLTFFEFFYEFFWRMTGFLSGRFGWQDLATDEIQLLVLLGVSASSAMVGTFLVLRKMTMLANSISHTILVGIVGAYLVMHTPTSDHEGFFSIGPMLVAALVMGVVTAYLTQFLTTHAKLQEDASTGLVFTTLFALGIILVTLLTRNVHIGTEVVMGNIDALQLEDTGLVYGILALNIFCFWLCFKEFKITTFDPSLANGLGISPTLFNYVLMALVSFTIVGAFRAVGVLMVLAFITGPPLMARLLTHDLHKMLGYAVGLGVLGSFIGVALARHLLSVYGLALSTSGIVVTVLSLMFLILVIFYLFKKSRLEALPPDTFSA